MVLRAAMWLPLAVCGCVALRCGCLWLCAAVWLCVWLCVRLCVWASGCVCPFCGCVRLAVCGAGSVVLCALPPPTPPNLTCGARTGY